MFALADCNNFYVSCERLFLPRLNGRAVVVLSSNDGNVVARSPEAKALGVQMGEPIHVLRERQRSAEIHAFSSNYTLYGDISARVMAVLRDAAPRLEVYSIDEAFLDLAGVADPVALARRARDTVLQWVGIPVSVGIAETKVLAKIANHVAKRRTAACGVYRLPAGAEREQLLAELPLTEVWGIADGFERRLRALGITCPLALRDAEPSWIRRHLGVVGERLVEELRGQSCMPLELAPPPRKTLCVSRSFGRAALDPETLAQAVATFTSTAAMKLRRHRLRTPCIQVWFGTARFRPDQPHQVHGAVVNLPRPTNDTTELLMAARAVVDRCYRPGVRYCNAGVLCVALEPDLGEQLTLDASADAARARRRALLQTVDAANRRWPDALRFAAAGLTQPWRPRAANRTPRWTTRWDELRTVR